jgi:hypothetical protein
MLYDKPFLRRCEVLCFEQTMSHIRFCLFVHVASLAGAGVTLGMTLLPFVVPRVILPVGSSLLVLVVIRILFYRGHKKQTSREPRGLAILSKM